MIDKKMGELNVEFPVLTILNAAKDGLSTSQLKEKFMEFAKPTGANLKPLVNRSDNAIDQIIRNIVSHRKDNSNNMINRGFIEYSAKGILKITSKGKEYLSELSKQVFTNSMK